MTNAATAITSTDSATGPTGLGQGTIKPGTYYLTKETFYPGAATHTAVTVASTLKVTVASPVATINGIEGDARFTMTITMASPATDSPIEEKITCTSAAGLFGAAGLITGAVDYSATDTQITLYIQGTKIRRQYTLQ